MTEPMRVERSAETDLAPDDLWGLVTGGWDEWLVDTADVVIAPGGGGAVVDDGVARTVRIDRLDGEEVDHRNVAFTWWPDDRPDLVSTVELVVLPARSGSRLRITETFASASTRANATATLAWDVRLVLLAARALTVFV